MQEADNWIDWLAEQNSKVAQIALAELISRTNRLTRFNGLGRVGRVSNTRELSLTKWRKVVIYSIIDDFVVIISVLDTRRNFPA